jgi:hypothetical protein
MVRSSMRSQRVARRGSMDMSWASGPADRNPVGVLQHAAGKLHVGVEGYRVGIQPHLQGGGAGNGANAEKHGKGQG